MSEVECWVYCKRELISGMENLLVGLFVGLAMSVIMGVGSFISKGIGDAKEKEREIGRGDGADRVD